MQSDFHITFFLFANWRIDPGRDVNKVCLMLIYAFFRRCNLAIFIRLHKLFFYYHNNEIERVWKISQMHCSECRSASFRTWTVRHSSSNRRSFVSFSRFKICSSSDWHRRGLCAPSLITVRVEFWARSSNLHIWVVSRLFVERFSSIIAS